MLTSLNGADSLCRAVTVTDLRAYFLRTGWQIKPFKRDDVILFEGPLADDGTPLVQLVPASSHYREFPRRVAEIVSALATIEQRPPNEILRDILTLTADILHLRLQSADTRTGTLELGFVQQFFSNMKDLLVFAACGQFEPRAFYPRALKQAIEFADRCRFRPAPAGSFCVDVETPIVPPANEAQITLRDYPVERLILVALMKGLGDLQGAINSGQTASLLAHPLRRINANLCEAILGMRPDTPDVIWEARVSWNSAWPMDEVVPKAVSFEGNAFVQIDSISRALRAGNERKERSLNGRIVRLSGKDPLHGESGPLVATVSVDTANAPHTFEMTLTPEQYRHAGEAHLDGHRITVKGILNRVGRKWQLLDVADFHVLNEATI